MRSKSEQNTRFHAFEALLDSKRETFECEIDYYGFLNPDCFGIGQIDDPKMKDLYERLENAIFNRYFGV